MKIIMNVRCENQWASDYPNTCHASLTEQDKQEIKKLAALVKQNQVYSINKFDYSSVWSEVNLDEIELKHLANTISEIDNKSVRVDNSMLEVTENHFKWTAIPKHLGDDMLMITNQIPLTALNEEVYIDLD